MTARTFGQTRDCRGCRYWSEMIAFACGGPLKAMCLGPEGQAPRGEYRHGSDSCKAWAHGNLGAIDDPDLEPDAYAGEPG